MLVYDLIYAAARQAHKLKLPGQSLGPDQLADGLLFVNQIVDEWAARKAYAYNVSFTRFTLTPAHQPHLIGPGLTTPDWNWPARPVRIENAALVLDTQTPAVDVPLNLRDDDWWANRRVKDITTNVPTDLYYSPDWPNGALYFWPVPAFAYDVRLELWTSLAQFASTNEDFTAPPAYTRALTLTLAEEMCGAWGLPLPPGLAARALRARIAVQSNNDKSPRVSSADVGVGGRSRGGFNYYSGE